MISSYVKVYTQNILNLEVRSKKKIKGDPLMIAVHAEEGTKVTISRDEKKRGESQAATPYVLKGVNDEGLVGIVVRTDSVVEEGRPKRKAFFYSEEKIKRLVEEYRKKKREAVASEETYSFVESMLVERFRRATRNEDNPELEGTGVGIFESGKLYNAVAEEQEGETGRRLSTGKVGYIEIESESSTKPALISMGKVQSTVFKLYYEEGQITKRARLAQAERDRMDIGTKTAGDVIEEHGEPVLQETTMAQLLGETTRRIREAQREMSLKPLEKHIEYLKQDVTPLTRPIIGWLEGKLTELEGTLEEAKEVEAYLKSRVIPLGKKLVELHDKKSKLEKSYADEESRLRKELEPISAFLKTEQGRKDKVVGETVKAQKELEAILEEKKGVAEELRIARGEMGEIGSILKKYDLVKGTVSGATKYGIEVLKAGKGAMDRVMEGLKEARAKFKEGSAVIEESGVRKDLDAHGAVYGETKPEEGKPEDGLDLTRSPTDHLVGVEGSDGSGVRILSGDQTPESVEKDTGTYVGGGTDDKKFPRKDVVEERGRIYRREWDSEGKLVVNEDMGPAKGKKTPG